MRLSLLILTETDALPKVIKLNGIPGAGEHVCFALRVDASVYYVCPVGSVDALLR